jgi:hypothetical protein
MNLDTLTALIESRLSPEACDNLITLVNCVNVLNLKEVAISIVLIAADQAVKNASASEHTESQLYEEAQCLETLISQSIANTDIVRAAAKAAIAQNLATTLRDQIKENRLKISEFSKKSQKYILQQQQYPEMDPQYFQSTIVAKTKEKALAETQLDILEKKLEQYAGLPANLEQAREQHSLLMRVLEQKKRELAMCLSQLG